MSGFVEDPCYILSAVALAVLGLHRCVGSGLPVVGGSLAVAALVGCLGSSPPQRGPKKKSCRGHTQLWEAGEKEPIKLALFIMFPCLLFCYPSSVPSV